MFAGQFSACGLALRVAGRCLDALVSPPVFPNPLGYGLGLACRAPRRRGGARARAAVVRTVLRSYNEACSSYVHM
jgi:hypothetical protein